MNVLVISHTYITPINRDKWLALAKQHPDITITVLTPISWATSFFIIQAKAENNTLYSNIQFTSLPVYFQSNELLYFYKPIAFIKLLLKIKPTIIHVEQGIHALSYFQAIITSKTLRLKSNFYFFTWINWKQKFSFKMKIFMKILEKFNLSRSHGAFAGNHDAAIIIGGLKTTLPILILPQLGVSTKTFYPARTDREKPITTIAFIGRLVEEKGVQTLLQSLTLLPVERTNSYRTIILGAGPYKKTLLNFVIQNNLESTVIFSDPVSHEEVAKILQSVDILVLPSLDTISWREQFGHILIEAMATKVCVVGSNAGEIPHVIGDAGVIFKQGDAAGLSTTLNALLINRQARTYYAQKGFNRVMEFYTHDKIAEATLKFWLSTKREI